MTSPKQFVRVKTEVDEDVVGSPVKLTRDLLKEVGNKTSSAGNAGRNDVGKVTMTVEEGVGHDETAMTITTTTTTTNNAASSSASASSSWDPNVALALPEDYDGQLVSEGWDDANAGEEMLEEEEEDAFEGQLRRVESEVEVIDSDADIQHLVNVPKIKLLRTFRDPAIMDRSNPQYKLFTSALYDVAKAGATASPSDDKSSFAAKNHFERVFTLLWTSLPFLETFSREGIKLTVGSQSLSLKSFVRNTMQKTYGPMLDKMWERRGGGGKL